MKKRFYIALGLLIIALLLFFILPDDSQVTPVGDTGGSFPTTTVNTTRTVSVNPNQTITISTLNGEVTINDVRTDAQTIALGSDSFAMTGINESGTDKYSIVYNNFDGSFAVALFAQPFGVYRDQATEELKTRLGLTNDQVCQLSVYVGVPDDVMPAIAGINLGLSGCPGSEDI